MVMRDTQGHRRARGTGVVCDGTTPFHLPTVLDPAERLRIWGKMAEGIKRVERAGLLGAHSPATGEAGVAERERRCLERQPGGKGVVRPAARLRHGVRPWAVRASRMVPSGLPPSQHQMDAGVKMR